MIDNCSFYVLCLVKMAHYPPSDAITLRESLTLQLKEANQKVAAMKELESKLSKVEQQKKDLEKKMELMELQNIELKGKMRDVESKARYPNLISYMRIGLSSYLTFSNLTVCVFLICVFDSLRNSYMRI